jgi:hypothetical protein
LSVKVISAYLEASPASLVVLEYNTHIGFNSQLRSEREILRSGQIIVSSQYNNYLSTQPLSVFLVACFVYLEETEFSKNFVLNFSFRVHLNFGPSPLWSNAFSKTSMDDLQTDRENKRATRNVSGDQEVTRRASIEEVNKQW